MTEETVQETVEEPTAQAPVVIKAENPSVEELAGIKEHIKTNYDFDVDVKEVMFNFKKSTDKETGIVTLREAVQLAIPYPSVPGLVKILETGGKQLELLMDIMADTVNSAARELLYEDTKMNASTLPVEKLSWEAIANMPKAQRRGGGIPKEAWEAFGKSYIAAMPEATGKGVEAVTNMARILLNKLNSIKTATEVLELVVEQLTIYAEAAEDVEEHMECVQFLLKKAEDLLNMDPADLLSNL